MIDQRPLRIRQQLLYLVLLLVLPSLALSLWQVQQVVDLRAEYELINSRNLARLTAAQIDAYLDQIGDQPGLTGSRGLLLKQVATDLEKLIPPVLAPYRHITLIDADDNLIYSNSDERPPWLDFKPGRSYLRADQPLSHAPWTAYAWVDRGELMATEWPRLKTSLITYLLLGTASLLLAGVISQRIVRPLKELQETAEAIAAGHLEARVTVRGKNDLLGGITHSFNHMAEQLAGLADDRSRFLRNTAHELRNPLAGVKGVLGLLRQRLSQGQPVGDLERLTTAMEGEIDRLSVLLTEMLETFQIQQGQWQLHREQVDFSKLLSAALAPFVVVEGDHRFVVKSQTAGPIWVWDDAARLEQVLRNLFTNAIKYSPAGGQVTVTLGAVADELTLTVADQGIGIPADQLNRIFEEFFRGRNLAADPGGIGLGLYYSEQVIQAHGGALWATSTEGVGTTFHLSLPTCKEGDCGTDTRH